MFKLTSTIFCFFTSILYAQVGIGTNDPKATLDVELPPTYTVGQSAGIAFPIMEGDQIEQMLTTNMKAGTLVYAKSLSTSAVPDVDAIGLWYWTGDAQKKWEPLNLGYKKIVSYFYAPSISLPTDIAGVSTDSNSTIWYDSVENTFNVKLYEIYKTQFELTGDVSGNMRTALKNPSATTLPTIKSNDLDYFITYFDNKVFDPATIMLDDNGLLKYKIIINPMISEDSFMNIVFKVK